VLATEASKRDSDSGDLKPAGRLQATNTALYDIALRDLGLALGALALGRLSQNR